MAFCVVGTKKIGGIKTELSVVPFNWVDTNDKAVYFPRNRLVTQSKDPDSKPDSAWLKTELVRVYVNNLKTYAEGERRLDAISGMSSDSESDVPKKIPRREMNRLPNPLPMSIKQYSLSGPGQSVSVTQY